ncbi:hypothetical protein DUNSADRAFT_17737 [Dunaliella salina]|nr:hypothetical protein DUNSADRAFT_17737 [Dunaliella salina]|eukprot:KAF5828366.1 hypothetical protein DUNSADRAFT_17737 [Dunaliella salina]
MVLSAYAVDKKFWLWRRKPAKIYPSDSEDSADDEECAGGQQTSKGTKKGRDDVLANTTDASYPLKTFSSPGSPVTHPKQKHSILYYRMLTVRYLAGESKTPEMLALPQNSLKEGAEIHDHEVRTLSGRFVGQVQKKQATRANLNQHAQETRLHGCACACAQVRTLSGRFVDHMQREEAVPKGASKLGFSSMHYSVLESQCCARVVVRRYDGDKDMPLSVSYATKDGTAVANLDYQPVQDSVPVTIVDDDESGMLMFELPTKEASVDDTYVDLPVIRRNGIDGMVTVDYATQDGTGPAAIAGQHYKATKGTLVFESGGDRARIRIPLLAAGGHNMLVFKTVLSNPLGGAVLGKRTMCRIIIVPGHSTPPKNKGLAKKSRRRPRSLMGDQEEFSLWKAYKEQYYEAIMPELKVGANNMWFDMLLHYISITWKLICATIPPSDWAGSYPTFLGANVILVGIIFLTKEVANLLGCELTLSPVMTGLTLVSVGTSLPDTFASRMATVHDDTADAAIGNITASNSANIFLGLGLPWIIAAGYYYGKGEPFNVPAGDLGFTLVLWCAGFGAMSTILAIRRFQGGELGGSVVAQRILMAWSIFLWLFFLVLSGVHSYNHFDSNPAREDSVPATGTPPTLKARDPSQLHPDQRHIHLVEVKYCEDTWPYSQLEASKQQHRDLCRHLSRASA